MEEEIARYLTKQDLIEANDAAIREKRQRTLSREFINSLPNDFIFVVFMEYYHTKDEMRLGITADLEGRAVFLDVSTARFFSLPVSQIDMDGSVELEPIEETFKRRPYPNQRQWHETKIKRPLRKQASFRKAILNEYDCKCIICDIKTPTILRAAHITPVAKGGDDSIENGLCLCTNHEILFDAGLLRIYPDLKATLYDKNGQAKERFTIELPDNINENIVSNNLIQKLKLLPQEPE